MAAGITLQMTPTLCRRSGINFRSPAADVPLFRRLAELKTAGFDISVVGLNDEQLAELDSEIEHDSLWKHASTRADGLRLATPHGFCRISSTGNFEVELRVIEELEVA